MPLAMEGPRPLSPLELEAFRLVFWDSIDPCDVYVAVIDDSKEHDASYGMAGKRFAKGKNGSRNTNGKA